MKLLDYIKIAGLLVACLMPLVVLVLAAMRFEQWRVRRALATFVAGIGAGRSAQVRGPGAWRLTAIEGTRDGCAVALGPKVLGSGAAVDVGGGAAPIRLKTMGYELVVRGPARVGRGELTVRAGALVVTGELPAAVAVEALTRAIDACGTTLRVDGGEVRADLDLPVTAAAARRTLALVDAIASYLRASG